MAESTESRRERRRVELLDAADRVIRRDGAAASMEGMATEAGITKPILYRHFGDKGGVYAAIAQRYVEQLMVTIEQALHASDDPREKFWGTLDAYLALIEAEPQAYAFLIGEATQPEARTAITDFTHELARRLALVLGEELARFGITDAHTEATAHALIGMGRQAGEWWLRDRSMSRSELADQLVRLVWNGFVGMAIQASKDG